MRYAIIFLALLVIALLGLSACAPVPAEVPAPRETSAQEPVGCSEDAKQCPDGSVVVRDAENGCEFPACPEEEEPAAQNVTALENQSDEELFYANVDDLYTGLDILDTMLTQYEAACPELACEPGDIDPEYVQEDLNALDQILPVLEWYKHYLADNPEAPSLFDDLTHAQEADMLAAAHGDGAFIRDFIEGLQQ